MENKWNKLNDVQKIKFKEYCDSKYKKTFMFFETGEPMYLDDNMNLIDTNIVIDLLINNNLN